MKNIGNMHDKPKDGIRPREGSYKSERKEYYNSQTVEGEMQSVVSHCDRKWSVHLTLGSFMPRAPQEILYYFEVPVTIHERCQFPTSSQIILLYSFLFLLFSVL